MTFVKTAGQLKIVLGFLTLDFSHNIKLNLARAIKHKLLYKAVAGTFSQ